MAKRTTKKSLTTVTPVSQPRFRTLRLSATLTCALLSATTLLIGVIWSGHLAAQHLGTRPRYNVSIDNLEFETPKHLDRRALITEVRYLSDLPDTVNAFDPKLSERLGSAFLQHPWIERVNAVAITPQRTITLDLTYRVPVLVVRTRVGLDLESYAVDAHGIVLPPIAETRLLPVFSNERSLPIAVAGKPWPEADVCRAAELVARHPAVRITRTKTGWVIIEPNGSLLNIAAL